MSVVYKKMEANGNYGGILKPPNPTLGTAITTRPPSFLLQVGV